MLGLLPSNRLGTFQVSSRRRRYRLGNLRGVDAADGSTVLVGRAQRKLELSIRGLSESGGNHSFQRLADDLALKRIGGQARDAAARHLSQRRITLCIPAIMWTPVPEDGRTPFCPQNAVSTRTFSNNHWLWPAYTHRSRGLCPHRE